MKPLILPAILAAALGSVGISTTVGAQSDDTTPPADEADAAPAEEAPPVDEETTPPTTEPPTTESSTPDTTVPEPEPEDEETTPAPSEETTTATTPPAPEPAPDTATAATESAEPAPAAPVVTRRIDDEDDKLDADADGFSQLPDGVVRAISFPVLGPVQYGNDWGNCRDGCSRRHVGTDMIGVRMQPLLAAVDGTVTRVRYENSGTAGAVITVTGADGWRYNYFHVNNDSPGTDDGVVGSEWQISPQVTLGGAVRAGQVIAFMGDSGNAETSVPHVHFEIRPPDGTPINPYHSLVEAQERQTCETDEARISLSADATTLSAHAATVIAIDGVGRWLIGSDGTLVAEGSAGYVTPVEGIDCAAIAQPTPAVVPAVPVDEPAAAPVAPADMPWMVERGQSLWGISQTFYGISDDRSTVSAVHAVFERNRDQLTDPSVLNIGMTLLLPPR